MNAERKGVFEPLNFDLRKGEILGITGLVGAKRTELARAIFGQTHLIAVRFLCTRTKSALKIRVMQLKPV